ncbi:MAG: M1 family metallopeptidase [Cyclobacteriaceae bacterium]
MKGLIGLVFFLSAVAGNLLAQNGYWQQRVDYVMNVTLDVETNELTGTQQLRYTNNSPDTLDRVFYHLYFNAFQPGSMMDVRARTLEDPDRRIKDNIYYLKKEEQGWHRINSLQQDGTTLNYDVQGTVLEVDLATPLLPESATSFYMEFQSQVPLLIRRCGRDNAEGIRYSMSQWFPKMAEYDKDGWHADPYINWEFYGPWGDYDVSITIDKDYVLGATGILQNPQAVGHAYADGKGKPRKGKLTWNFKAENVHDFVWAADPELTHVVKKTSSGIDIHYLYQSDTLAENWQKLHEYVDKTFAFMEKNFVPYPYSQYSIIQGGEGGTEYPMATLVTGHKSFDRLLGTAVHEICHNWIPMLVAPNETLDAWIDEGFAEYAEELVMMELFPDKKYNFSKHYDLYLKLVDGGKQEVLSKHADHFVHNNTYVHSTYFKGGFGFHQLASVIGKHALMEGFRGLFREYKFRHIGKSELIRAFEKTSGIELDWYFDYWINSTATIDYAIRSVVGNEESTDVMIERVGDMPMPLDIVVELKDGKRLKYYVALGIMRGQKTLEDDVIKLSDWPWVNPYYEIEIKSPLSEIKKITIDKYNGMADINRSNNSYPFDNKLKLKGKPED